MQVLKRIAAVAALALASFVASTKSFVKGVALKAHDVTFDHMARTGMVQGMVLLSRGYAGYASGTIVQLPTAEEAALVAQGFGTVSAGPVTNGNVTTNKTMGRVGLNAGASVQVTNPLFTTESKFVAYLSNAAADATATFVTRIQPANGSVTFFLNAASTGVVAVDWALLPQSGLTPTGSSQ